MAILYKMEQLILAKRVQVVVLLLCGAAMGLQAVPAASIRVIEPAAIPYMRFLSKAEFDQRYPGQELETTAALKPGWYVSYVHESLNYYFGPVLLQATGADYKAQLETLVTAAVAQRPSIEDYELALTYEQQLESEEPAVEPKPQVAPEPLETGFWGFVRRVFGLGR